MTTNIDWHDGDPEELRQLTEIARRMAAACCGDNATELWAAELHDVVEHYGPIEGDFYVSLMYRLSVLAADCACGAAVATLGADADARMIHEAARHAITTAT
jgi:hypothetical protein